MTATSIRTTDLIRDAIRQVAAHPLQLLQITALVWLLQLPAFLSWPEFTAFESLWLLGIPSNPLTFLLSVLLVPVGYLGIAWGAVGWHRLILIGERPGLVTPRLRLRIVMRYFLVSLVIQMVWLALQRGVLSSGSVYLIAPSLTLVLTSIATMLAVTFLCAFVILRLSPLLVGIALEQRITISSALAMTAPINRQIALTSMIATTMLLVIATGLTWVGIELGGLYMRDQRPGILLAEGIIYWITFYILFIACISTYNAIFRAVSPNMAAGSAVS